MIAFLKLQGWLRSKPIVYPAQQPIEHRGARGRHRVRRLRGLGDSRRSGSSRSSCFCSCSASSSTLPIGGADMPVVISLFNALTGIAVALDGFALVERPARRRGLRDGHRGHPGRRGGFAAHAPDGPGDEPLVSGTSSSAPSARPRKTGERRSQGSMKPIEVDDVAVDARVRQHGDHRPRVRDGGRPGPAEGQGAADLLEAKGRHRSSSRSTRSRAGCPAT